MEIKRIKLTNFRSHQNFSEEFSNLTIIIGPNGVGKTNIIESILLASTTKSHRTNYDRELIAWENDYTRTEIDLLNDGEKINLATFITTNPIFSKSYLLNNAPKKASEIVGLFQSVLFSPESLDLVYQAPSLRRRFMDIILCQSDHHYLKELSQYNQVVKERNKLLFFINKGNSHPDELQFWDEKLMSVGSAIIKKRQALYKNLSSTINQYYQTTSGTQDKAELIYKNSVDPSNFDKILIENRNREIRYTTTLFGPHRDDLLFYLNDHPLVTTGSRGECRSFILALKLSEIDHFTKNNFAPTILLLDDVFSELDGNRRQRLTDIIKKHQTVITTTDLEDINPKIQKSATIIHLPVKS